MGGLVTLVMGRWEAQGGSRAGPRLERKSDPRSLRGFAEC